MIFQSLTFWTLVAGLAAFVARWYFPAFPFDQVTILAAVLFVLGLIGITPQLRARGAITPNIINSLAFWQLVAGLAAFVLHFFAPNFPFDQVAILAFILFILGWYGITPELRMRGLLPNNTETPVQPEATPVATISLISIGRGQLGMILMLLAIYLQMGTLSTLLFVFGAILYLV